MLIEEFGVTLRALISAPRLLNRERVPRRDHAADLGLGRRLRIGQLLLTRI